MWHSLIDLCVMSSLVHLFATCTYMDLPLGFQSYLPHHRTGATLSVRMTRDTFVLVHMDPKNVIYG